jgi:hypothetical protein
MSFETLSEAPQAAATCPRVVESQSGRSVAACMPPMRMQIVRDVPGMWHVPALSGLRVALHLIQGKN